MADLSLSVEWLSADDEPTLRETSAHLSIHLGNTCLTRNEDIWSRTVRDTAFVSAYPLAIWFASSWWRLNYEPLPSKSPTLDWRMSHELGAANHGFVWPRILFAPNGESMQVWAEPLATEGQSLRYLHGVHEGMVETSQFQLRVAEFIGAVTSRLEATGLLDTELHQLWQIIQQDQNQDAERLKRIVEAKLGFDPEECPEDVLNSVLALETRMGREALMELAPALGLESGAHHAPAAGFKQLLQAPGISGKPDLEVLRRSPPGPAQALPWQRGVEAAKHVRDQIGSNTSPIETLQLLSLLGLPSMAEHASPIASPVAVARPSPGNSISYIFRKKHPVAKRFEWARLIGALSGPHCERDDWSVSSDITTAEQQRQRAFAAELLCPIESLVAHLDGDYSESGIEDAAAHFGVSELTIEHSLQNNGHIQRRTAGIPYALAA